jgi:Mn-containing catalase
MSDGDQSFRGPWNEGQGPWAKGEKWQLIKEPVEAVKKTNGLSDIEFKDADKAEEVIEKMNRELSEIRREEIRSSTTKGPQEWQTFANPGIVPKITNDK